MAKYNMNDLSAELRISPTYLLELRRKMGIKTVGDNEYVLLKSLVEIINRKYGKVTLSTINAYLRYSKYE